APDFSDFPVTQKLHWMGYTATGSLTFSYSDIRLKRDIIELMRLDNGIGLYRYRYRWSDQLYVGVMAQEVAEIVPDAVMRDVDGYLRVDYVRLGLKLQTWEEWTLAQHRTMAFASSAASPLTAHSVFPSSSANAGGPRDHDNLACKNAPMTAIAARASGRMRANMGQTWNIRGRS